MSSLRMFWSVFAGQAGLLLVFVSALSYGLAKWNQESVRNEARARLSGIAAVVRGELRAEWDLDHVAVLRARTAAFADESRVRITLVASDGTVIADSVEDPASMQNHSNRPDLIAAREQGRGQSVRRSPTFGRQMQYYSLAVDRGGENIGFVRVSVDEPAVGAAGWSNQRVVWGLALMTLIVMGVASHLRAKAIIANLRHLASGSRAMAKGDFEPSLWIHTGDAFEELAVSLSDARAVLARRIASLEDHNQTLETVLGGMVEGVLAVDADRQVLLANDASLSLLKVTGPVVGRPLLEVVRHVEIETLVAEAVQVGTTCEREVDLPGPPRRILSVLATQLASSARPAVVVVMHDVTALRRLENMRRDFAANVSHELKTPLASIKAYSETLRMGTINDSEHNLGFVERISEAAERLDALITDVLHLARVEAGEEAFQMGKVDVGAAIDRCVALHRQLANQQRVTLAIEPCSEAAIAWADRDGVFTILTNLLSNAVKYTPNGGQVTIRCFPKEDEVVIEVKDTGIGIASEDHERVFERFFRVDTARAREFGGTGLGLAIVKHLAQGFSGSVGLESEVEQGSTFCVRLPRSVGEHA